MAVLSKGKWNPTLFPPESHYPSVHCPQASCGAREGEQTHGAVPTVGRGCCPVASGLLAFSSQPDDSRAGPQMKFIVKQRLATPAFPGTAQLAIGATCKSPAYSENVKGTVSTPIMSAAQHTRCHLPYPPPHFAEGGLGSERLNVFVNVREGLGHSDLLHLASGLLSFSCFQNSEQQTGVTVCACNPYI